MTKLHSLYGLWSGLVLISVVILCSSCRTNDATPEIRSYFARNPDDAKRYIAFRLTSIKSERERDELCDHMSYNYKINMDPSADGQKRAYERYEKAVRLSSEEFVRICSFLQIDEDDPVYWFKYIRSDGETAETGYLVVRTTGSLSKYVQGVAKEKVAGKPLGEVFGLKREAEKGQVDRR